MDADTLSEPLKLRCGVTLPNRLVKAAMTEGLADEHDRAGEALATLYRRWSEGGAGLLLTGNVMVDRRFLERPGNVVIDDNDGEDGLRAWAQAGTAAGNQLWMQISHPGRQCNRASGFRPLAPSATALDLGPMFLKPRAMSEDQIEDALERYVRVAATAKATGFTGVQIHGAHGYLISQFLSPRVNRREDDWGGSLENRSRFLLECVRRVRTAVGEAYPISVKLNSSDFQKGAFDFADCRRVALWLDEAGIDLLEISGGTYEQPQLLGHAGRSGDAEAPQRESTRRREAYFLEYARQIAGTVEVPLLVTGGFRDRAAMAGAIETGDAQAIGLGRPLCVDPDACLGLLDGSLQRLPSWEQQIVWKSRWFGPASPLLAFKIINVQGEVAWFYRQLIALAEGRYANTSLGLLRALFQHLIGEFRRGRRRVFPRRTQ